MDRAAAALALDPAEIRRINLIADDAYPWTSASGLKFEKLSQQAALAKLLKLMDYKALRAEQAALRKMCIRDRLKGVAKNITCPIFIVSGRLDRIVPAAEAERLAQEVSGPCELLIIPDGNHVANNRPYLYRPQTADFLAKLLGGKLAA